MSGLKRIKKAGLMVLVILLALLAGCSRESETGNGFDDAASDEVVIKWLVFGQVYKDSDAVFSAFNQALSAYFPDTRVEFEVVDKENYQAIWDMKMAINEPVDLAWIGNDLFNYTEEVKKGSFTALDYLLSTYGQDLQKQIPKELWDLQIRDGNTFSIPIEGAMFRKTLTLVTSKEYAAGYDGFAEIGTININSNYMTQSCYDAMEGYLLYAKENDVLGTGVAHESFLELADKGLEGIYGPGSPFVIKIYDDKLTVYNKYEMSAYRDYFKTMARWYELGYIRQDIANVINPSQDNGKKGGNIIFLDDYEDYNIDIPVKTEYEAVYLPLENKKYVAYDGSKNALVIPKSAQNPQRAIEVVNFLITDEGKDLFRLLTNGIEKEHYIVLDNETIVRRRNDEDLLYFLSPYTIGDTYQNFELRQGQFNDITKENDKAIRSQLIGFNIDTRMVSLDMATVDLVVNEYLDILSQGTAADWEQTYDEFIEKMREAGSDSIINQLQRQLNDFKP